MLARGDLESFLRQLRTYDPSTARSTLADVEFWLDGNEKP
jgi:hypothetical protein